MLIHMCVSWSYSPGLHAHCVTAKARAAAVQVRPKHELRLAHLPDCSGHKECTLCLVYPKISPSMIF